jgi:hypothetical protein
MRTRGSGRLPNGSMVNWVIVSQGGPMPDLLAATLLSFAAVSGLEAAHTADKIADDYPRALAVARERGMPIFIDAWAPW